MRRTLSLGCLLAVALNFSVFGWNNGQTGNTGTNTTAECSNPPYATHDWIADHALDFLPVAEKAWLVPHRATYLIGTEAPDNKNIAAACGTPHRGYDDRIKGHSVLWNAAVTSMVTDRPADRAREEYQKAVAAYQEGDSEAAAFYLGAMAHYLGDVAQYGHNYRDEVHHGDYEGWAATLTAQPNGGTFESYLVADSLVNRTPYTAVKRVSKAAFEGKGRILKATEMDNLFPSTAQNFMDSVGDSLNLAVNEMADVLHTFFLNVVSEE